MNPKIKATAFVFFIWGSLLGLILTIIYQNIVRFENIVILNAHTFKEIYNKNR